MVTALYDWLDPDSLTGERKKKTGWPGERVDIDEVYSFVLLPAQQACLAFKKQEFHLLRTIKN